MTFSVDGPRYAKESTSAGLMEIIKFASVCRPYGRKIHVWKICRQKISRVDELSVLTGRYEKSSFLTHQKSLDSVSFLDIKNSWKIQQLSTFESTENVKIGDTLESLSKELFILSSTFDFSHRFSPEKLSTLGKWTNSSRWTQNVCRIFCREFDS